MPTAKTPRLDSLDDIARNVRRAQESASFAGALADSDPERARSFALKSKGHCTAALTTLETIGAQIPGIETDAPMSAAPIPLQLLDTPVTRRLLALLEEAAQAGAEVDRERGFIDADGQPCGWGDQLAGNALGLRYEIFGPSGRD